MVKQGQGGNFSSLFHDAMTVKIPLHISRGAADRNPSSRSLSFEQTMSIQEEDLRFLDVFKS